MADLDNFFAKKDKKKVKGRKYDNPDDIAKRLKESEKKLEKELFKVEPPKKTLDVVLSPNTASTDGNETVVPEQKVEKEVPRQLENTSKRHEEEEWKDFMDEAQKDLTNLKISKLNIEDEEDGMMGYGSGEDEGGPGAGNRSEGVWSKNLERLENEQSAPEPEVAPVPSVKEDPKSQTGSSYVPPHLRGSSLAALSSHPKPSYRKSKAAPDITSAMAFPSLSDAQTATPAGAWGRRRIGEEKGFENVKHGSTKNFSDDYAPPKVSTANRFDALSDNS